MVVVSNSSPIIHLTKIGKLSLLEKLYGRVLVPEKVYLECTESVNYTEEVALITNETYIKKHIIENTKLFRLLYADIDAGESEALVLALEQKADLILLDDQEARIKARKLNLPVTGTLGVLLKAKNQGLIRSLKTEIQTLQASGFWLSQEIVDAFLSHSASRG